jgi:hypothetical protein
MGSREEVVWIPTLLFSKNKEVFYIPTMAGNPGLKKGGFGRRC